MTIQAKFSSFHRPLLALAGVLGALLATAPASAAVSIVDLGLEYPFSKASGALTAIALGEDGQVIGSYRTNGQWHAFVTGANGVGLIDLTPNNAYAAALGINAAGQVVGYMTAGSGVGYEAFFYDSSSATLRTLADTWSRATAINASGQVTGDKALMNSDNSHAYISAAGGGALTDFGTLGTYAVGSAVNDLGQVVGSSKLTSDGYYHAFVATVEGGMRDLGTLGDLNTYAGGINNAGVIVGTALGPDAVSKQAFVGSVSGGPLTALPTLGGGRSAAFSVSESGLITGWAELADGSVRAVLWQNGAIFDLNGLDGVAGAGWTFLEALDINERGQILGEGAFNGQLHFFLMSPVPEASTWLLTALGLVGAVGVARSPASRSNNRACQNS